jgi:hypothetical protein
MRTILLGSALLVSSACTLANMTPKYRFSESAHNLADAARWGHVDMAMQEISPKYGPTFMSRHREWGAGVNIADVELVQLKINEDDKTATSEVTLSWYAKNSVTLRESVISQRWEKERGNFRLVDESVRSGDESVFAPPEEDDEKKTKDS